MSGHSTIFQKIAYSANFGHNDGKTTMSEKGRVSFSESHRLGLCGSEVKTCLHWSAYRTNWAPRVVCFQIFPGLWTKKYRVFIINTYNLKWKTLFRSILCQLSWLRIRVGVVLHFLHARKFLMINLTRFLCIGIQYWERTFVIVVVTHPCKVPLWAENIIFWLKFILMVYGLNMLLQFYLNIHIFPPDFYADLISFDYQQTFHCVPLPSGLAL